MRIVHRFSGGEEQFRDIRNVVALSNQSPISYFTVSESDDEWPVVEKWAAKARVIELVWTEFSTEELDGASHHYMGAAWHSGYPSPDNDPTDYIKRYYDTTNWCSECGIGAVQDKPFRVKLRPPSKKRGLVQLNWAFDTFFTRREVWERLFEPFDVGCRPVYNPRGKPLADLVQLIFDGVARVDTARLTGERSTCPSCGRSKWLPTVRGVFPVQADESDHACLTDAWFGTGAAAYQIPIVSAPLYREICRAFSRDVEFSPCGPCVG